MYRYMVRKEYFGAYVYDRKEKMYLLFDKDSYDIFNKIDSDDTFVNYIEKDILEVLNNEEFILRNKKNFYIVDNGEYKNVFSAPMRMHLLYTKSCNLNCIHCFSHRENKNHVQEMSFYDKIKIIDEMKKIGMCEILIGGGEPFIKDDIFEFIKECNNRDIIVKIFTNGLLFNDKNFSNIVNAKIEYLAVSIDGSDNNIYKNTRGIDGLPIIKDNIKKLKENKCKYKILVSTTINHHNCIEPEGFLKLMVETGADRLKIRATKPNGNIITNHDVMVTPEEYKEFLRTIQKLYNNSYKDKFQMDITWGDFRLFYDVETDEIKVLDADLPYDLYGCVAGKTAMCIDAEGIGSPCGFLPANLQPKREEANVLKHGILKVWHECNSFKKLRELKGNEQCIQCDLYETCRGGCIARNIFVGNKADGVDPWCIKKYFPIRVNINEN